MNDIKYLYHATSKENAMEIIINGFNDKVTFFCTEPKHTGEFMSLYHGKGTYTVIEVDVSKLDLKKLEKSNDHNPDYFSKGLKAYVYNGEISAETITDSYLEMNIE
ncbi:hypothetical protein ACDI16_12500 [Oceanobacillus caeni]